MLYTPIGMRTFEGYERNTFNYAAKSLADYLRVRISTADEGKAWNGVVIRGTSPFATLPDPKQQLVMLWIVCRDIYDGAAHNNNQMRNAAVECVWAWLYHMVRNEVQHAIRTGKLNDERVAGIWAYNLWECLPAIYSDDLATKHNYYTTDLDFWEEIIDKIATQSVYDNKTARTLHKMDNVLVTDQNLQEALNYFNGLQV